MLDANLEPAAAEDEPAAAVADGGEAGATEALKSDEELADEVIVEISVDGMCGVY